MDLLSTNCLFKLLGCGLILYLLILVTYRLFFSPLARAAIPGPWYAAISDLWILSHVLRMRRCRAIHEALEAYSKAGSKGKIVRIAPNTVIFVDIEERKKVYGVQERLWKSQFYKSIRM